LFGKGGKTIRILVTNDDGVHAPGIIALAGKLKELGDVTVVAPAREVSGVSHALTLSAPLRYERIDEHVFSVEGTPTDCINLAVGNLLSHPPELLVSGINRGANLGDDVTYSGTVAGAMEGAIMGISSFAVSLASKSHDDYGQAAEFAVQLGRILLEKKLPRRTFLNVNVPTGEIEGVRITTQGHRNYWAKVEERIDPRSRVYFWIKQGFSRWEKNGVSDINAVRENQISITPLHIDFTNYEALEELASWEIGWNGSPPETKADLD
jgi:5'-nucleotidase